MVLLQKTEELGKFTLFDSEPEIVQYLIRQFEETKCSTSDKNIVHYTVQELHTYLDTLEELVVLRLQEQWQKFERISIEWVKELILDYFQTLIE